MDTEEIVMGGCGLLGLAALVGFGILFYQAISKRSEVNDQKDIVARMSGYKKDVSESTIYVNVGTSSAPFQAPITTETTTIYYNATEASGSIVKVEDNRRQDDILKDQKLYRLNVHRDGFGNWHLNSAVEANMVETEEYRRAQNQAGFQPAVQF